MAGAKHVRARQRQNRAARRSTHQALAPLAVAIRPEAKSGDRDLPDAIRVSCLTHLRKNSSMNSNWCFGCG